jgi:hypothetical protein
MEEGIFKGDVCNRDGCKGIIDEHEKEGGCSCHINPPCSYCTTDTSYCPVCDWSAQEELDEIEANRPEPYNSWYEEMMTKQLEREGNIRKKMRGELPITKLEYLSRGHTNSSMEKEGVYPDGMTAGQVRKEVNGTFGGRFERFSNGVFRFIAYTD